MTTPERFGYIYWKTKYQALAKFKILKALVEAQSGFKVKCLRTDNGLEFCNEEFKVFFIRNEGLRGIRHKAYPSAKWLS